MSQRIRTRLAGLIIPTLALTLVAGCGKDGADSAGKAKAPTVDTANFPGKTGVMSMTGSGPLIQDFSFTNVYATIWEQPMAGETQKMLTVEGHIGASNTHFKLRFIRNNGTIEPGGYSVERPQGDPPRKLDATLEHGSMIFKSIGTSIGTAEIKTLDDAHVMGTFSLKLVSLSDPTKSESLIGSFDALVQK